MKKNMNFVAKLQTWDKMQPNQLYKGWEQLYYNFIRLKKQK